MKPIVKIGHQFVGEEQPTFIIAEIGINHNGDIRIAKELIDVAVNTGCDAVKFQKRTPELCVPPEQKNIMRETPWGYIPYIEYRHRVEFSLDDYREIDDYCRERGILWFASCWDENAVDFMEIFHPPCYKIQSAAVTNLKLLKHIQQTRRPVILSTGMSTMEQIHTAVNILGTSNLIICHSTSTYPCPPNELNLQMIQTLQQEFPCPIGYSGHEVGLVPSVVAVAFGACVVERHITLDRSMWGSDHSASIEPGGLEKLVKYIRTIEVAVGDGTKRVYESELSVMKRLRQSSVDNNGHDNVHSNESDDDSIFLRFY
ncbi:N-acetylneuraminate synthase family protein [candidate division KSB1 bacterium]|nr:N-acetylneuraminate synthase family protein [candidate division KSB1 bacterium]